MIQIIGDITHEAFKEFDDDLSAWENGGNSKVKIRLMSTGGDAEVGLAFYDRIRLSPLNITITAYGLVGSAAALIFLAGDVRVMTPNSCLYVHEESGGDIDGQPVSNAKRAVQRLQDIDNQYNELMASRCDIT